MDVKERALAGALGGFGGTFVLSGLRWALASMGMVFTTAPEQVVARAEEVGLLDRFSSGARKALVVAAHFAYGTGIGAVFGALRREPGEPESDTAAELQGDRDDKLTEAAVGAALGVLSWGAGWAVWLPITGVHPAPWT
ncbi:MAG: hypothetical protein LC704_00935, partial [Actinobacteria bacterium]|nr:hypothetical protein [Actinomycetota bacterium]